MPRRRRDEVFDCIVQYSSDHGGNAPGYDSLADYMRSLGYKIHRTTVRGHINSLIWEDRRLTRKDGQLIVCGAHWIPPDAE